MEANFPEMSNSMFEKSSLFALKAAMDDAMFLIKKKSSILCRSFLFNYISVLYGDHCSTHFMTSRSYCLHILV